MTKRAAAFRKLLKSLGYDVPRTMTDAQLIALEDRASEAFGEQDEQDAAKTVWNDVVAAGLAA